MRYDYEQLSKIWQASAQDNNLSREELSSVELNEFAASLANPTAALSLRVEGHFVYGLSQIWQSKARLLLQDSLKTDENIGLAFREYIQQLSQLSSSSQGASRAARLSNLELSDTLELPQSLLGHNSAARTAVDADLSIDALMRGEDEGLNEELSEGDIAMRTAEDRAVLEDLDLGIDLDDAVANNAAMDNDPGNLDFGSDLAYSSSPPHTPGNSFDVDVQINAESSPAQIVTSAPAKKRRGATIDQFTKISRPRKATPSILRHLPQYATDAEESQYDKYYIPTDPDTERLLDPSFVQQEMRRRRLEVSGEMDVDDNTVEFGDFGQPDLDLDLGDIDFNNENNDEEEISPEDVEEEDTPEMLETEQRRARDVLKRSLRRKDDTILLEDVATTAKQRACTLMEILSLAARGRVKPEQEKPWGALRVVKI